jgi:hypothetical protein
MLKNFHCVLFDANNATQKMVKNFVYELQQLNKTQKIVESQKDAFLMKFNGKLETILEE